ncbi:MAG: hypothetical protein HRU19_02130 [Pseudobacteriovorax sp.]|nr:hypothetical protein [Pseudobacteriovorax sp.]
MWSIPAAVCFAGIDISQEQSWHDPTGFETYYYIGDASPDEVRSNPFQKKFIEGASPNIVLGFINEVVWFRVDLENKESQSRQVIFADSENLSKILEIYDNNSLISRFQREDTLGKRHTLINVPAFTSKTIFIRKKIDTPQMITWGFWPSFHTYNSSVQTEVLKFSVFSTTIAMSIFFSLMLLIAYKEKIYAYYLGYILSIWAFALFESGLFALTIFSDGGDIFPPLSMLFCILFTQKFVVSEQKHPRLYKFFTALAAYTTFIISLTFVHSSLTIRIMVPSAAVISIICSIVSIHAFYKYRKSHVGIYILAYNIFLVSVVAFLLRSSVGFEKIPQDIAFIGAVTENILMLLALGKKIWDTEQDRKRSYATLNQKHKELTHSYSQLSKVFFPHQLQQIQTGHQIEDTMPVGEDDACVICFDIINSSEIKASGMADLVEEFMGECRTMMEDHYDPEKLVSSGYMIKEMGDGFLCSVGFTFRSIKGDSASCAVELAERIIRTFSTVFSKLSDSEPVYCGIGIAKGKVKGYFSKSGSIRHDLWGPAIVSATRYEAARKDIFRYTQQMPENILVLQENVFDDLPKEMKQSFTTINLKPGELEIRNAPEAKKLPIR